MSYTRFQPSILCRRHLCHSESFAMLEDRLREESIKNLEILRLEAQNDIATQSVRRNDGRKKYETFNKQFH